MLKEFEKSKIYRLFLFFIAFLVGCAMGVINPIASTHMTEMNTSGIWVGIISSTYYIFLSAGAILAVYRLKGKNMKSLMTIGLLTASISSFLFPILNGHLFWWLLMALMGIGISFNMTGVQTLLHSVSDEKDRGIISGLYSFFFAVGFIISSVAGPVIYGFSSLAAFSIGSLCLIVDSAMVFFLINTVRSIPVALEGKIIRSILSPLFGAFIYGFSETTLITLYPVFLLNQHYSLNQMGTSLAVFVAGSIVGILPLTWLSDRTERKKVVAACMIAAILTVFGIVMFDNFLIRLVLSFLAGFAIGPLYPLFLSVTIESVRESDIASGTSFFTFSYGFGSAVGPFLTSVFMQFLGNSHIFTMCLAFFIAYILLMVFKRFTKGDLVTGKGGVRDAK